MFIRIGKDYAVALEESDDFKHFKLVVEAPRDPAKLGTALAGVASIDLEGHAWVSEEWLRRRDPGAGWQDGLTAMIGVAKKYGWVDERNQAIRAHVEWPNEAKA